MRYRNGNPPDPRLKHLRTAASNLLAFLDTLFPRLLCDRPKVRPGSNDPTGLLITFCEAILCAHGWINPQARFKKPAGPKGLALIHQLHGLVVEDLRLDPIV